jgi:hypothetical protein
VGWQADLYESLPVEETGVHLRIHGRHRIAPGHIIQAILKY